jgi:hypothetical protein
MAGLRIRRLFRAAARHTELGQLRGNHPPVNRRVDLLVDVEDASVEADEEGPP